MNRREKIEEEQRLKQQEKDRELQRIQKVQWKKQKKEREMMEQQQKEQVCVFAYLCVCVFLKTNTNEEINE